MEQGVMEIIQKQRLISFRVSNQGFTLLELVIGMAVSLLAMGAIYSTFLSQHKSYLVQDQTAAMQQNLRAAMFYMQREIRMAGLNPLGTANAGIVTANASLISFTEDIGDGAGNPPDGTLQTAETITYSLTGGNLVRNVGGGNQVVAQNIDALDFVYLTGASPPVVLNPGGGNVPAGSETLIKSVEITIVARTDRGLLPSIDNNTYWNQQGTQILAPPNDNLSRRRLTTVIKCRNL
jgi:type IV pilus assembly protein PilW